MWLIDKCKAKCIDKEGYYFDEYVCKIKAFFHHDAINLNGKHLWTPFVDHVSVYLWQLQNCLFINELK